MVSYHWSFSVCTWKLTICQNRGGRDKHCSCLHGSYNLEEKTVINQLIPNVMSIIKGEEESAYRKYTTLALEWSVVRDDLPIKQYNLGSQV